MEVKKLETLPTEITPVFLEALLMPNGELMRFGKSLGFVKETKGIFVKEEATA